MKGQVKARFHCRLEPSGTWMVWDDLNNAPARLGGCSLVGRTRQRAKVACELLTRIYDKRLGARSLGGRTKASVGSADRVGELITSIRKARDLEKRSPSPIPGMDKR